MAISSLLQTQYNLYQGTSDNSLLRIKMALAERYKRESTQIREKYNGGEQAQLEADLEAIVEKKASIGSSMQRVQAALGKIDELRNKLLEMRAAADLGSGEAFDLAYSTMATITGSAFLRPDNLMANTKTSSGSWRETTEVVIGAGFDVNLTNHFLGSDYAIELNDGSGFARPNLATNTLEGGSSGTVNFADITNPSVVGDQITFTDSATGNTYTGTLKKGGGQIMNAWAYENFTGADPDAAKAQAKADIDAALERIRSAETEWSIADAHLSAAFKKTGLLQEDAAAKFQSKSLEIIDAKNAELKAAKSRFELVSNSLALAQGQQSNFVFQMFMTTPNYEKKGLFEIIGG